MRWFVLFGLWLSYLAFGATIASLAPLVAVIQADLDISHSGMGSVMGAWQLVYIGAAIPCGMLLDRLGGRRALFIGLMLVFASAMGRSFAEGYWSLLVAVMLFGLGGPIVSSGAPKMVTELFPPAQRGLAMGIYMTGPTIGGILALTMTHAVLLPLFNNDWRGVLQCWAWLAFASALIWLTISTRLRQQIRASIAANQIHTEASLEDTDNKEQPSSAAVLVSILRLPAARLILLMSIGAFLFNHGLNNWLPELLGNKGLSPIEAGYLAALPLVVGVIGSLTIPRLATQQRRYKILIALGFAATITSLTLMFTDLHLLTGGLILQGFVRSSLMTVLILSLVELPGMKASQAGVSTGLFFTAAEIGGVLGPLGLGLAYDLSGGFDLGLAFLSVVGLLMATMAFRLQTKHRSR